MSPFEVIVLGVGDSFSERYVNAALLLSCDDFWLAIKRMYDTDDCIRV